MKFLHRNRQKIKDFTHETSYKDIFAEYGIVISTNFTHKIAKIQLLWTKIHYTKF